LVDVGPLTFVPSPDALVDRNGCARVRDDGNLITLGPVDGTSDRIQVGVNGFLACLGANSLTYRVQQTTQLASRIDAYQPAAQSLGWAVRGRAGQAVGVGCGRGMVAGGSTGWGCAASLSVC
jgi:hypothetical protein